MGLATINIRFTADLRGFSTEMQNSMRRIGAFGNQMKAVGQGMSMYLTAPILGAGAAAIKFASDYNESLNKVDVSFKDSAAGVKDFAKTSLESFGIAEGTALDLASSYGDMGTSLGLSTDKAAKMSTSLVGLAGDLASFKNISIDVANTALAGVFTGETESLKKLGIVMTEANLQNFAYSRGLKIKIADMDQASKVNLRYAYIMSVTKNAQGDFARTGGGAANQMRIFQESLKQVAQQFGSIMIPAFTKAIVYVNGLIKSFGSLSEGTKGMIITVAAVVAATGPLLTVFGSMLTFVPNLITKFNALKTTLMGVNAVIVANPYTAAAIAIGLIAAATYGWYSSTKNVVTSQEALNKAVADGNKNAATEVGTLDKLYASATNVKGSIVERKKAVDQLQELYPAYFKNIDDEAIKNGTAKTSYDELRNAIFNKARATAVDAKIQEIANDRVDKEIDLQDKKKEALERIQKAQKALKDAGIDKNTQPNDVAGGAYVYGKLKANLNGAAKDYKEADAAIKEYSAEGVKAIQNLLDAKKVYADKTTKLTDNEKKLAEAAAAAAAADLAKIGDANAKKAGTIAFYNEQIEGLQKLQKEIPTTNSAWKIYESQIDAIQKKIDALQNKGVKIPKPQIPEGVDFKGIDLNIPYYEDQIARYKKAQDQFSTNNEEGRRKYQEFADKIKDTELIIQDIKGGDAVVANLDLIKSKSQELKEIVADAALPALTDAFSQMGEGIVASLGLAKTGFGGFIAEMIKTVTKLLAMMLAASISQSIAGATASGASTGPLAIFTTPAFIATAVAGVLGAFAAIPKFEYGGIVGGSSYYGDKIMARVNSAEMISNTDQQKRIWGAMNGGGSGDIYLNGGFDISGDKLQLILERAEKRKNRIG